MKFCSKCGKDNFIKEKDAPNIGFGMLGFFIPPIGLILWLCFKGHAPLKAKSAGKGAIVGVCANIVLTIFLSIL